jgi:hypothetical protein
LQEIHHLYISGEYFIPHFLNKINTDTLNKLNFLPSLPPPQHLNMATMEKVFADYKKRTAVIEASTNPFAKGVAWVAGELVPLYEARIPLLDQGFLHSDLTYDVPSVWDGLFFRLDDHLERLSLSCSKIRLKLPLPAEEIKKILLDMVAKSGIKDAFVELIVTRGFKGVREAKPEDIVPNLRCSLLGMVALLLREQCAGSHLGRLILR